MTDKDRLEAFERMQREISKKYTSTSERLTALKAEGKEKSATYRQLFATKLQLQTILNYYRTYGLLEE